MRTEPRGIQMSFAIDQNSLSWRIQFLSMIGLLIFLGCGGGGGSSGSQDFARYASTANRDDDSVSAYTVDDTTGRLHFNGTVAAGSGPGSVTVDSSGQFVYVANEFDFTVSQYRIRDSGRLTPLSAPTVATGEFPISVITVGSFE